MSRARRSRTVKLPQRYCKEEDELPPSPKKRKYEQSTIVDKDNKASRTPKIKQKNSDKTNSGNVTRLRNRERNASEESILVESCNDETYEKSQKGTRKGKGSYNKGFAEDVNKLGVESDGDTESEDEASGGSASAAGVLAADAGPPDAPSSSSDLEEPEEGHASSDGETSEKEDGASTGQNDENGAGKSKVFGITFPTHCVYCDELFNGWTEFRKHLWNDHSDRMEKAEKKTSYRCYLCEHTAAGLSRLQNHVASRHRDAVSAEKLLWLVPLPCTWEGCPQRFSNQYALQRHMTTHKPGKPVTIRRQNVAPLERRWKQTKSNIMTPFHKSARLRDCHESCQAHYKLGLCFSCNYCEKTFRHHSLCVMHEVSHCITGSKDSKDADVQCPECELHFPSAYTLRSHTELVHRGKVFQCSICSKCFTSASYKKQHEASVHSELRQFLCQLCGQGYKDRGSLRRHQWSAHKLGPGPRKKCAICGSEDECGHPPQSRKKNYPCRYCNKRFMNQDHCRSHENIHTGNKCYACPICDQRFAQAGTLHNHLYKFSSHPSNRKKFKIKDCLVPSVDMESSQSQLSDNVPKPGTTPQYVPRKGIVWSSEDTQEQVINNDPDENQTSSTSTCSSTSSTSEDMPEATEDNSTALDLSMDSLVPSSSSCDVVVPSCHDAGDQLALTSSATVPEHDSYILVPLQEKGQFLLQKVPASGTPVSTAGTSQSSQFTEPAVCQDDGSQGELDSGIVHHSTDSDGTISSSLTLKIPRSCSKLLTDV